MNYQFPTYRIFQFAKAPGERPVKTRLAPTLSLSQRRALHCAMCCWICRQLCESSLAPLTLLIDGDPDDPLFDQLARDYGVGRALQQGGDLGQRMLNAVKFGLKDADGVILVGSDCPFIDTPYVGSALKALAGGKQVVVGPATDGGYVLLGLKNVVDSLFSGIEWGSTTVFTRTRERLESLNWSYAMLPVLDDIDRPGDLALLSKANLPEDLRCFANRAG